MLNKCIALEYQDVGYPMRVWHLGSWLSNECVALEYWWLSNECVALEYSEVGC